MVSAVFRLSAVFRKKFPKTHLQGCANMQKTFPHPFHFSVVFRKKIIENYKKKSETCLY